VTVPGPLTPADVEDALDRWRRFAKQNALSIGHPDRVVFLASYLNEALAARPEGGSAGTSEAPDGAG
jgi:hypothetical protein